METRAKLETALAAVWDRDTLAVYADHLQAEGDPRGELIALDLEIEAHGNTVELSKRRTSLLYVWLGALVPVDNVHAAWVGDSLRFGFVEDLRFDGTEPNALARFEQVLASPAGPYVRGLTMAGSVRELEAALAGVARGTHRWLTRLAIGRTPIYGADTSRQAVDAAVARAAFDAMPRLATLELRAPAALGALAHSTIEQLVVRGADVYAALGAGASFDAVAELVVDLAAMTSPYGYDDYPIDEEFDVEAPELPELPAIAFPSLRRLDLAANRDVDSAYRFLRSLDARAHVTHLRIPQLRNAADRDALIAAIRDMRALEVVEVAHGHYYDPPELPNVRLVRAERWRWPTQELARGRGLRLYQPLAKYGEVVAVLDAVLEMERAYEALPAPARAAWSQFWTAVDGAASVEFPARILADALDACPELMTNGWRELREELAARRPFAVDAVLKIERCKA